MAKCGFIELVDSFAFTIDTLRYAAAEQRYREFLSSGGGERLQSCQAKSHGSERVDPGAKKVASSDTQATTTTTTASSPASGLKALSQQIEQARLQIQSSLKNGPTSISGGVAPSEDDAAMREENLRLKKQLEDLQNQVRQLTDRVTRLEGAVKVTGPTAPIKESGGNKKAADDDDDVDLFGSEDEEDTEAAKIREQRLAEYAAKKSKKPTLIAKSNVILDVKPWDDETDMKELEVSVRAIEMDGLLWGASKLVPLAYSIKKLQISCVVEDDKVSIDELTEKIQENEEFVQSVDIAAFNKI
ncbi:Elongation factor 1-beta [Orchesella cincta]|uniref:Elongation factor 1-beta n=1 Tax=Orchesella cincta TaxID=48709 RepID=A0A1D2MYI2_ORCCI|nr:Elongation factor 1-beta [Orchesella cincta]